MKKKMLGMMMAAVMAVGMFAGCGGNTAADSKDASASGTEAGGEQKVLRVGMECAYAPFNWTQETEEVSNGVADVAVIDVPTAESAAMTNSDLKVITLDENDTFQNDQEMTNVCIATRKDDTELRDKIQGVMDKIGWNDKAKMDEMMDEAIKAQPAAN